MKSLNLINQISYGVAIGAIISNILSASIVTPLQDVAAWNLSSALTTLSFILLGIALLTAILICYKNKTWKNIIIHVIVTIVLVVFTKFTFFIGTSL